MCSFPLIEEQKTHLLFFFGGGVLTEPPQWETEQSGYPRGGDKCVIKAGVQSGLDHAGGGDGARSPSRLVLGGGGIMIGAGAAGRSQSAISFVLKRGCDRVKACFIRPPTPAQGRRHSLRGPDVSPHLPCSEVGAGLAGASGKCCSLADELGLIQR